MTQYLYGEFEDTQFEEYINQLHKKLFFLLLYKDPKTQDDFIDVDFDAYFKKIMVEIDAFNKILQYPKPIVELVVTLQEAYDEQKSEGYDWKIYRKHILDAHGLIDRLVLKEG